MSYPTYRLETLGTVVLKGPDVAIRAADQRQQRRRLALLAALASSGDRGMSRDQLLLLFWPDSTQKKARHSLDQLLYAIRTSLGESIFLGTNPIRLNPGFITSDVADFTGSIASGDFERAVNTYTGPFLDGFYLSDTREFEEWSESERRRLAYARETALDQLAIAAERSGDFARAVHWRRKLAESDPLSTRYALGLIAALANAGDTSAAIAYGERFERDSVEAVGPNGLTGVRELLAQIRNRPTPAVPIAISAPETRKPEVKRSSRALLYTFAAIVTTVVAGGALLTRDKPVHDPVTAARGTANLAAYDLYVRGRDQVSMRSDSTARLALDYFRQAVDLDSGFAAAHAGLATMYTRLAMSSTPGIPRNELRRRATASANRALTLNDSLAEAHVTLGLINAYWLLDLQKARMHLERAKALDPKNPQGREYLALVYTYIGRPRDALRELEDAVSMNRLAPVPRAMLAATQYMTGRCDLAIPALDSLAAMKPPLIRVSIVRSLCHASASEWQEAAATVRATADAGGLRHMGILGFALARSGDRNSAIILRDKLRAIAKSNQAAWFDAGLISYGLGEVDVSVSEMEHALAAGFLGWEIMGPPFDGLRANPRFATLARNRGVTLSRRNAP